MITQLEGIENLKPCGAIVKYNPCTKYARGSPCLYFKRSKKCGKPPLACEMPQYDNWYKEVLKRDRKCFYPNRVRLLENPGVLMFIFHVHHHAIMGEAQIVGSTIENGRHFYWFDEFVSYPHPVQLELLQTDSRLPRIARRGQWLCVYISKKTIEEIRRLSKLSGEKRKKLSTDLRKVLEQLRKHPPYISRGPTWEFYMRDECQKLKTKYKLNERILAEAQKYFSKSVQKKLSIGRSFHEMFYASLYLAFRMLEIPKLLNDITEICGVSSTRLRKLYRLFARELNLTVPPLNPEQLIKSRSGRLDISEKTIRRAISIAQEARKKRITLGKAPSTIAAVAVYVACLKEGEEKLQKEIAQTFGVSTGSIRNYYRNIEEL